MRTHRKYQMFDIINCIFLVVFSLTILLPFLMVISQSLMTQEDIMQYGYTLFPKSVTLGAYKYLILENKAMIRGFMMSVLLTASGTFFNMIFTTTLAYGLSRKSLPYRNQITMYIFITMVFSGGLIPSYLLITGMGLKDSFFALILPGLIGTSNMLVMRNFFMSIPESLIESAYLDGAGEWTVFSRIIIPLSKASIATIALFYAVGYWNSWFGASIYLSTREKWPMQLMLREMMTQLDSINKEGSFDSLAQSLPKEGVKAAAIIITSIPIICVYPFVQKYFVKGVMIGSIKG